MENEVRDPSTPPKKPAIDLDSTSEMNHNVNLEDVLQSDGNHEKLFCFIKVFFNGLICD